MGEMQKQHAEVRRIGAALHQHPKNQFAELMHI